jgi:hypothetical protein
LAAAYPDALQSWTRDLVVLPGGIAIVLDRLAAEAPRRFDLLLHPYGSFRIPYPVASPGEILIGDEENPTRVSVHSEVEFTPSEQDGYYLTTPRKYVRFDSPAPTQERTYLTICEWPSRKPGGSQRLDVSAPRPGRWQIRRVGADWRLMVRTGEDADANDSTDARLVAVWDQGEKSRERHALILAGRRLGVDNRELMRATRPVYAAIEFGRPVWAHFWTAEPTRVSLTAEVGADYVFVNGQSADVVRRSGAISFDLPSGESTVVVGEVPRFIPRPRSIVRDDLLAARTSTDAPAFQPGVIARSSSCVPEALLAIDGDANTGWSSLPGAPFPQWMEVALPAPAAVESIRLETGGPCAGRVEVRDRSTGNFVSRGTFTTTIDTLTASLQVERSETDRIRVIIEKVAEGASSATIKTAEWK